MNILEPIWVSTFTKDTYSCIKERGIHACAKSVKAALKRDREGTKYCLKIDVRKFYPSINHEVLKGIVRRKIKDSRLLALLDEIIDSNVNTDVPIRNYVTDPTTGELVCDFIERRSNRQLSFPIFCELVSCLLRPLVEGEESGSSIIGGTYDDIVILAPTKEELHALLHDIREYFTALQLKVKHNYQVFPVECPRN